MCRDVAAGLSQVLYGLVAVELSSARASVAYLICKATRRATEPQMDALPHGGRCTRSPPAFPPTPQNLKMKLSSEAAEGGAVFDGRKCDSVLCGGQLVISFQSFFFF